MNRRRPQSNPTIIILTAVLTLLFTAAAVIALVFISRYSAEAEAFMALESDADYRHELAQTELYRLNESLAQLKADKEALKSEKEELIQSFNASDERYRKLNELVTELDSKLLAKQLEIDTLHEDIAKLESVYRVDINAQVAIIAELEKLLSEGAPNNYIIESEIDENGAETEIVTEVYPNIALFYQDISRGYTYSYNDGEVFYSASCLKAPFALSLLQAATAEQEKIKESGSDAKRIYDFDEVYTYKKEDAMSGSGIIINEPDGTEFTFLRLIELMLTHSDNVAFDQLKKKYSTAEFRALAIKAGTSAMKNNLAAMTASDGGRVLLAAYDFIISGSVYSQFLYDSMVNSIHRVMIPAALNGKKVAHKYGWDISAYHDMGIVFDKNPYVVVILTDLDRGGTEVDTYVRSVLKLIDRLHENFYK